MRTILSSVAALVALLAGPPSMALDPREFLEGLPHKVSWEATPSDLLHHRVSAETVLWIGEVEKTRVSPLAPGGSSVEWLARHRSLEKPSPSGLAEPIELRESASGSFVVRLNLPETPPDQAKEEFLASMGSPAHVVVSGEPEGAGSWEEKAVVYVRAHYMVVSDELAVHLTPARDPDALAEADERPAPLVLEPNRFSYTFDVPDGWTYSFEQAQEFGLPLVFFYADSDFHHSRSVVYVNELCSESCEGRLERETRRVLTRAERHEPSLRISPAPSIDTASGAEATVRILEGSSDPRQAREALALIAHPDAILLVVLSTKDPEGWETDFAAFSSLLSGHEFFTCDSPGLRVRCRSPAAGTP